MERLSNLLPRVALFPDTFYEANGVATLSRELAEFAKDRGLPLLVVRGGDSTRLSREGSLEILELKRGPASFSLDKGLYCDPFLTRHRKTVIRHLREFMPDLVHITGPGDLGFLGLWVAHAMRTPLVASWHTNLHEYLSKRLEKTFRLIPRRLRTQSAAKLEQQSLRGLMRFYKTAHFLLAPNQEIVDLLKRKTGRPAFLMPHGVDLRGYQPSTSGCTCQKPFHIGYVGRLTTEKNVCIFAEIEHQLLASGEHNYKFLIVGEGGQQSWLRKHLRNAEIPGVLRGEQLAAAYSRMDAFVFPSSTDTFGLVILEAMASGVPVIVSPETGKRIGIEDGVSGVLSNDYAGSVQALMKDSGLRHSIGRAGRDFVQNHSWASVFEQLYNTYAKGLLTEDTRRLDRETRSRR